MNKILRLLLFLLNAAYILPTQAIVYGAKTFIDTKGTHPAVTLFYSQHIDKPDFAISNRQRKEIVDYALKYKATVAAEDPHAHDDDNTEIKRALDNAKNVVPEKSSIIQLKIKGEENCTNAITIDRCLIGIVEELKNKVPAVSVECRVYKEASLHSYKVTGFDVFKKYDDISATILKSSHDRTHLVCLQIIKSFWKNNGDLLNFMRQCTDKNLADFFKENEELKKIPGFDEYLSLMDSPLVNAKMLHTIDSFKNSQHILMIAGGDHCDNVSALLPSLGYELKESQVCNPTLTEGRAGSLAIIEIKPLDIAEYFKKLPALLKS